MEHRRLFIDKTSSHESCTCFAIIWTAISPALIVKSIPLRSHYICRTKIYETTTNIKRSQRTKFKRKPSAGDHQPHGTPWISSLGLSLYQSTPPIFRPYSLYLIVLCTLQICTYSNSSLYEKGGRKRQFLQNHPMNHNYIDLFCFWFLQASTGEKEERSVVFWSF